MGNHWTKADLYGYDDSGVPLDSTNRIYVNQGAIGRIIDLEQNGYVYIHEAYEDRDPVDVDVDVVDDDSKYKLKGGQKK
jgi:hypothetical protein